MAIAGIVTFTATDYSPVTDKITLYYGIFNPCIWFDHYPAKAFAVVGMGVFIFIGICFSMLLFLWVYIGRGLCKVLYGGMVVSFVTNVHLIFVNVFTTNLYPQTHARLLHGAHFGGNQTMSLVHERFMNQADMKMVRLHTCFYIAWLMSEVLFNIYILSHVKKQWQQKTLAAKTSFGLAWAVGLYGMVFHMAAMLVIVLQDDAKVDWYLKKTLPDTVQEYVILTDAWTYTSAWGWLPVMFYRLAFPTGYGVSIAFSLRKQEGDDGHVLPERWVGRCIGMVACIMALGGVFSPAWELDGTEYFKLSSSLRSQPYAYFAAPAYLASTIVLALGLGLTVVQKRLMQGQFPVALFLIGLSAFLTMFASLLGILDQERITWGLSGMLLLSYMAWVLLLNRDSLLVGGIYCVVGAGIAVSMCILRSWYWPYMLLLWFCAYKPVVPDGALVHLKLSRCLVPGDDAALEATRCQGSAPPIIYEKVVRNEV